MKAIIQKVELRIINAVWKKHKPQGLGFSDTDVIIVTLKTTDGKMFDQDFYCRLKADGTLGHSLTKASEKRQKNVFNLIRKYISKEERYNIRENINQWKGKEVNMEELDGGYSIKL